jgi:hypothetical protein
MFCGLVRFSTKLLGRDDLRRELVSSCTIQTQGLGRHYRLRKVMAQHAGGSIAFDMNELPARAVEVTYLNATAARWH